MAKQKKSGGKKNAPAISVITSMYNMEKYVTDCLESLLAQTFQDFEVLVADDGSTDNSVAVVSAFTPKFEGRLKLIRMKKNTGFPGVPRNEAMKVATGKYITFLDSDDLLTENALEYLYNVAEEKNAEVIHVERYYTCDESGGNRQVTSFQKGPYVEEPTIEPENTGERINNFINFRFLWWGANKLFRRDFLVKNGITFPAITAWEDFALLFCSLLKAKIYVRVPEILYIYRQRDTSLSHKARTAVEMVSNMIGSVRMMDKAMGKNEFLVKNPEYRYRFLDWYIQNRLIMICKGFYMADKWPSFQIDDYCRKLLFSVNPAENTSLLSYFFTRNLEFMVTLSQQNIHVQQLAKQISDLENKIKSLKPAE